MTLRYEGKQPVGLDWSAIDRGDHDPTRWGLAERPKTEAAERPGKGRPGVARLDPAIEHRIIRLYRDDQMSGKEVALAVGVQSATVFKVLNRNGVKTRTKAEGMALSRTEAARRERRRSTGQFQ
jgi:hypothetical protein